MTQKRYLSQRQKSSTTLLRLGILPFRTSRLRATADRRRGRRHQAQDVLGDWRKMLHKKIILMHFGTVLMCTDRLWVVAARRQRHWHRTLDVTGGRRSKTTTRLQTSPSIPRFGILPSRAGCLRAVAARRLRRRHREHDSTGSREQRTAHPDLAGPGLALGAAGHDR